jgi:lantibiotic modifying enzyme
MAPHGLQLLNHAEYKKEVLAFQQVMGLTGQILETVTQSNVNSRSYLTSLSLVRPTLVTGHRSWTAFPFTKFNYPLHDQYIMNKIAKKLKKKVLRSVWMYLVQAKVQWLNLVYSYTVTKLGVPKMAHNFSTKRAILHGVEAVHLK